MLRRPRSFAEFACFATVGGGLVGMLETIRKLKEQSQAGAGVAGGADGAGGDVLPSALRLLHSALGEIK